MKIITPDLMRALIKELQPPAAEPAKTRTMNNEKPDRDRLRELLAAIPGRPEYDVWLRIISAVADAVSDSEAIGLLQERWPEENEGEYAEKLKHRLKDVHVGSLFKLAMDHGWKFPKTEQEQNKDTAPRTFVSSVPFSFDALMEFDPENDPKCMIGHRWLVRGGSTLWAAGAGYGKSALALQLAIYWACGQQIFGLRPRQRLKSLILQAENDLGDCAEQMQGVLRGIQATGDFDIESCKARIRENVIIHQVIGTSGGIFITLFEQLLAIEKPDIAWIDPLFAFAGCDLLNPKETGLFLREGLFPLAIKNNIGLQVIHHAGKPKLESEDGEARSDIDYQYLGFGTSEIQNAFRAVNVLVPVKGNNDTFKLVMSKRGERSGTDRTIYLQHSRDTICWMQVDAPEESESDKGRPVKYTATEILSFMTLDGVKAVKLYKHIHDELGMSSRTFYRLWDELKKGEKIRVDSDELWYPK
jgi:hypothetical protein